MRRLLSTWAIILISLATISAQETTGIRFEQSLKWSGILAKAKQEHKYIFVDCYATWCGPCKWMDANVYPLKEVGDAYNQQFISVRVQMDKTSTDDSLTKARYSRAEMFADDYHVNAYPTFLFFDENGNPVHKVSGSLDEKQFIQLAKDAQNPNKQYYAILKSFEPGKLDTAEEKGLAWGLINSDKQLAGKLATDYLSRILSRQLGDIDNLKMMIAFQGTPPVQQQISNYLNRLPKDDLGQGNNLRLISDLKDMPQIKAIVLTHIYGLSKKDVGKSANMDLMRVYDHDSRVQSMVKNYMDDLGADQLFSKQTLYFLSSFTHKTTDKEFAFFYGHTHQVDSIIGKDWAEGNIRYAITQTCWQPEFNKAKQSGDTPDFNKLAQAIENKFTKAYAIRIIADAKVDWYGYDINDKKENQYWPEYTQSLIDLNQLLLTNGSTIKDLSTDINNTCYTNIFLHSDDTAQLNLAVKWMADVAADDNGPVTIDTYACCLYKDKQTELAIEMEKKAMEVAKKDNWNYGAKQFAAKITDMENGYPIWERKEYQ